MATTVLNDLPARLKTAAEEVRDAKVAYDLALEQRDALVVTAVDTGMSQKAVAEIIGVAKGRISPILASSQRDADG